MKKTSFVITAMLVLILALQAPAETLIDGFLQGLYGAGLDGNNPTATDYTANETRLQTRLQHYGDNAEFFGRLDFMYDAADSAQYDWELREGYLKFRLGSHLDFKVGRQIITWGTGDLIFINDVFAKDYRSFFVGRDDQYLKAPQTSIRTELYTELGSFSLVLTPRFEANRLPTGRRLSYFNPFADGGSIAGEGLYFEPPTPDPRIENGEVAARFSRQTGNFNTSLYFYRGFYKNPMGLIQVGPDNFMPVYPRLNLYGASARGTFMGGILWLEGGYYDSRDDKDNVNPMMPNSSLSGMVGFERQVASNLTANLQWQITETEDDGKSVSNPVESETYQLLTSRITKLLYDELITLSAFAFYSPTDEDTYIRLSVSYKHTDELTLAVGGNIFDGTDPSTQFGQFQLNDNLYVKMTYGF